MNLFRKLLAPIVPVYYAVTWLRNKLYDANLIHSKSYNFPLICVGNLSTGGTGKTPMVEYLIRLLKDDYKVATLSRGYKRNTKGFVLAKHSETAKTIGDEPYQFYKKYKSAITVAVDANRQNGIAKLRELDVSPEVIILDDAFQHRKVKAGYYILLTTYTNLYANDWVLPTGDLREPKQGAKRANCIVVTKCPNTLSNTEKQQLVKKLNPLAHQKVFFSTITYADNVVSENKNMPLKDCVNFTLVTGIANAKPLVTYLKGEGLVFNHLEFNDHHFFSDAEIDNINKSKLIITTEKDYVRLQAHSTLAHKLYYLPIEASIDNSAVFDANLKAFISLF